MTTHRQTQPDIIFSLLRAVAPQILALLFVFPPGSPAQEDSLRHNDPAGPALDTLAPPVADPNVSVDAGSLEWHSMVTNVPGDWARGARASVQCSGLETIAGISILTGVLVATDGRTYSSTQQFISRHSWMRSGCDVLEQVGNGRTHIGVAAAFALVGVLASDSRALRTASQTIEGLLASGIVVQALKHVTGRESPAEATAEGGVWRFFPNLKAYQRNQARYYAFPSGHIATTMSTVTIIAENYPEARWIRPVGYTIVGLVGVGLIGVGFHWYSDLPLGVAIGYLFGTIAAHRDNAEGAAGARTLPSQLTVLPSFGRHGPTVNLALAF